MRLLLDTHIAIWAVAMPWRIQPHIADLLQSQANAIHVSAVSIWEIAIKHSLGKRSAPPFAADRAIGYFNEARYMFLNMTPEHAAAVGTLPPHHGDPFDRLLIAQALTEPLRLVTADRRLHAYSDIVIPC